MRILLAILVTVFSFTAFAHHEIQVRSWGNWSGWCDAHNQGFCIDRIGRDAEWQAVTEARNYCWNRGGDYLEYTARCYTWCSPNYIPHPPPGYPVRSEYVSCRSDCDSICKLR